MRPITKSVTFSVALFVGVFAWGSTGASANVFDVLKAQCGKAFEGQVTRYNDGDEAWRKARIVMHIRDCSDTEMKIPLHVDANRSRVWIVSKTQTGYRLKHDHRHEDGHPDDVTMYGGDSGAGNRQVDADGAYTISFPVDQESIKNFQENGLTASVTNVWHLSASEKSFSYRLTRENRDFMVTFDLTQPVAVPPAAWDKAKH